MVFIYRWIQEQVSTVVPDGDQNLYIAQVSHFHHFSMQHVQWSLFFKTTHGTKKMWSYIAGGLKIKVIYLTQKIALWDQIKQSYNQGTGDLKIEGCKIEALLYMYFHYFTYPVHKHQ